VLLRLGWLRYHRGPGSTAAGKFARVDLDACERGWDARPWGACELTGYFNSYNHLHQKSIDKAQLLQVRCVLSHNKSSAIHIALHGARGTRALLDAAHAYPCSPDSCWTSCIHLWKSGCSWAVGRDGVAPCTRAPRSPRAPALLEPRGTRPRRGVEEHDGDTISAVPRLIAQLIQHSVPLCSLRLADPIR
jgi:hypothetical protein